jgi:hypothetical protein
VRLRLQARPIAAHPGFPRALRLLALRDGAWVLVLRAHDVVAAAGEWWEGAVERTPTNRVRLEVDNVGWRANRVYFVQFMQLELLEAVAS